MRFRLGLVVGLALGYYYGARAGRERYEQIERVLEPIRQSEPYQRARTSARDAVGWTVRETGIRAKEAAFGASEATVVSFGRRAG